MLDCFLSYTIKVGMLSLKHLELQERWNNNKKSLKIFGYYFLEFLPRMHLFYRLNYKENSYSKYCVNPSISLLKISKSSSVDYCLMTYVFFWFCQDSEIKLEGILFSNSTRRSCLSIMIRILHILKKSVIFKKLPRIVSSGYFSYSF